MEPLLQLLLIPKRWKFRRSLRKSTPASEKLISLLRERCEEATRAGSDTYLGIYNAGLFVALLNRDITTYNESIFFARSAWHRQFHARNHAEAASRLGLIQVSGCAVLRIAQQR